MAKRELCRTDQANYQGEEVAKRDGASHNGVGQRRQGLGRIKYLREKTLEAEGRGRSEWYKQLYKPKDRDEP